MYNIANSKNTLYFLDIKNKTITFVPPKSWKSGIFHPNSIIHKA